MKRSIFTFIIMMCIQAFFLGGCGQAEGSRQETEKQEPAGTVTNVEEQTETEEFIGAGQNYDDCLSWTLERYAQADTKEQERAAVSYGVYIYRKQGHEMSPEKMRKNLEEIEAVREILGAFSAEEQSKETTLQVMADSILERGKTNLNLDTADMRGREHYLNYTASDWKAASAAEQREAAAAFAQVSLLLNGQDAKLDFGIEETELDTFVLILEHGYQTLEGTDYTMRDALNGGMIK